ncbi:MAG: response regulator [Acidobacteriota bacterium]
MISSSDAEEAILKAKVHKDKIDLLISDVILPEKKGPELAEEIRRIHSKIKVLYISGYADNRISLSEISEGKAYFLSKPFTPSALARKVREVLDIFN